MTNWKAVEQEFYRDGSLRDLYVQSTSLEDWDALLNFLKDANYSLAFSGGLTGSEFPEHVEHLFPKTADDLLTLLSINVDGVMVNCHFFTPEEIEFDIEPSEVNSEARFQALLAFIKGVSEYLGKDVILTPENMQEIVILRYRAIEGCFEHKPFGGFR